jgi:CheY-like chemotaxis protein
MILLSDPLTVTGIFLLGASAGALVTYAKQKQVIDECRKALELSLDHGDATTSDSGARFGMKSLIVGRDPEMIRIFSHLLHEKRIETYKCSLESAAIDRLSSDKFEVIVLDFDHVAGCAEILKNLPCSNQHVLVIAVATEGGTKETAARLGASFVIAH